MKRGKICIQIIVILLLSSMALAANDPGHDTLYIEEQGSSTLNGTLNITQNLSVTGGLTLQGAGLTLYGDGTIPTPGTGAFLTGRAGGYNDMYLDAQGNIYIKNNGGDMVFIGGGTPTDLNVSGLIYSGGQKVCLANGTNCIVLGGASSGGGWTNNTENTTTSLNVGIGTTSPTQKLHIAGSVNISGSSKLYTPEICLAGTCLTSWPSGSGGNLSLAGSGAYIPQIQNATLLNNSVIFQNNSNIGIGTTSVTQKLTVLGNISVNQSYAMCFNSACTVYKIFNGTCLIEQSLTARIETC